MNKCSLTQSRQHVCMDILRSRDVNDLERKFLQSQSPSHQACILRGTCSKFHRKHKYLDLTISLARHTGLRNKYKRRFTQVVRRLQDISAVNESAATCARTVSRLYSTSDKIRVFFLQPKSRRSVDSSGLCCHEA
ncbi:reverse transcriptase [Plakobranchus ocellatus]|uniref:Reverse transcriptase n=1 Tax=Plakobranchus ocellatus TaxID=259542 RepID=A0AAV3ZTJ3_9GAST|nr:reverse transcriptase [Plakobranchus ocellatus]